MNLDGKSRSQLGVFAGVGAILCLGYSLFLWFAVVLSALDSCEEELLPPIYLSFATNVVVAVFLLLAVCFPVCWLAAGLAFGLIRFFALALGLWHVALCFSYDGWLCRETLFRDDGRASLTWTYVFALGLLNLAGGVGFSG